jgi:hypothetical protein
MKKGFIKLLLFGQNAIHSGEKPVKMKWALESKSSS